MLRQRRVALGRRAQSGGDGREVAVEVAARLGDAVSAELLEHGLGQHDRHHRLRHHSRGRDRADVRPLVVGCRGVARGDVDALDADPLRCFDPETSARMVEEVDAARKDGDTLGGIVEVLAYGLPPGLGSHVHWDRRLDGRLAQALMSIQAIKGVEVGDGFETTRRRGSAAHDELFATDGGIARASDRAGGTEGGMSTGTVLRVRAGMKPIATVPRALRTVDVTTGDAASAHHQRSDVCAVPAAGVVAEAMVAIVLAEAVLEKFGGDSVAETRRNLESYLAAIPESLRSSRQSDATLGADDAEPLAQHDLAR